jgi:threonine synthase
VRRSAGAGVAVSEGEIDAALAETARAEGILPCLEGAAAVAGLRRLVENGGVEREARVVVFNTGAGLKVL